MTEPLATDIEQVPNIDHLSDLDLMGGGPSRVSPGRQAFDRFLANRPAVVGVVLVVALVGFSFLGPLFYHTNQVQTDITTVRFPPSWAHPLGTDEVGYDQLGRLMVGGAGTIEIGVGAGLFAAFIGTLWGAIAGYVGGVADSVMMRIVDSLLSIPTLLLVVVIATIVRPSVPMLVVVFGVISWLVSARLVRAEALTLRTRLYVEAFKAMGGSSIRAIVRHIVPNAIGTVIVLTTFLIATSILLVAYLSFLGLGLSPPATTWGNMLTNGINYVYDGNWWLVFPPGVAIILLVLGFTLIGDGLRDAFDVRAG